MALKERQRIGVGVIVIGLLTGLPMVVWADVGSVPTWIPVIVGAITFLLGSFGYTKSAAEKQPDE